MEKREKTMTGPGRVRARSGRLGLAVALAAIVTLALAPAASASSHCSNVARAQERACFHSRWNDFWTNLAACRNLEDSDEREECREEGREGFDEAREECADQLEARFELCDGLGEGRYDPDFDPADFDDDFSSLTMPNPFAPLRPGNRWIYEAGEEEVNVRVLDRFKLIEGVTCIVVNDRVFEDGVLIEDTDDWYGHHVNGDVWYCGEVAENFESFEGDDPELPELVDIDGSFKAGRDRALPGILVPLLPVVGDFYRQEVALGEAEDAVEVLSTSYSFGADPDLDLFVPPALARALCGGGDCRVTRDFTPLEPDAEERKYYAPGIGVFLEVDTESGDILELVECNVHPRCGALP